MLNKLLPLGSVVKVKGKDNLINIIGYFHSNPDNNKVSLYEYTGIDYDIGLNEQKELFYFDEDSIEEIWFVGYATIAQRKMFELLHELYIELKKGNMTMEEAFDKIGNKYFSKNLEEYNKIKEKYFPKIVGDKNG